MRLKATMHGCSRLLAALALFGTLSITTSVAAELIWDGDAAQGTDVFARFGRGNCEAPSSLTAVDDPTFGQVWRYHKPSGSDRCESHGFRVDGEEHIAQEGETWYLGWWSKLNSTGSNNANFQWKSYGEPIEQNFPLVMKMVRGQMTLMQVQPGGRSTFVWQQEIGSDEWHHYVLGIHVSGELMGGWIEFWFNGEQQTFEDGSQRFFGRTLDGGNHNCPKWGVYGASGEDMSNWIAGLKVGTAYNDVKMEGAPEEPPPAPGGGGSGGSGAGSDPTPDVPSGGGSASGGDDGSDGGSSSVAGSSGTTGPSAAAGGAAGAVSSTDPGGIPVTEPPGGMASPGASRPDTQTGEVAGSCTVGVGASSAAPHSGWLAFGLILAGARRRQRPSIC